MNKNIMVTLLLLGSMLSSPILGQTKGAESRSLKLPAELMLRQLKAYAGPDGDPAAFANEFMAFWSVPRSAEEGKFFFKEVRIPLSPDQLEFLYKEIMPGMYGFERFERENRNGYALSVFGDGHGNYEFCLIFLTPAEQNLYLEAIEKVRPSKESPYGHLPPKLMNRLIGEDLEGSILLGKLMRKPLTKEEMAAYEKAVRSEGPTEYRKMTPSEAGKRLLALRAKEAWVDFAKGFRMFFQTRRSEDEGKLLLDILKPMFRKEETAAIVEEILSRKTAKGTYAANVLHRCSIDVFGNAAGGEDIRLLFFTDQEVEQMVDAKIRANKEKTYPIRFYSTELEAKCMGDPVPMSYLLGNCNSDEK